MNWLAMALILLGYFLLTRRNFAGFVPSILGSLLYIFLFYGVDWSVVTLNTAWIFISLYGVWKWLDKELTATL